MTVYSGETMGSFMKAPPEPASMWRDYPLQEDTFKQGWSNYFSFHGVNHNPYFKGEDGFWASYEEGFERARGGRTPKLGTVWSENYDEIMQAQEAFEKVK